MIGHKQSALDQERINTRMKTSVGGLQDSDNSIKWVSLTSRRVFRFFGAPFCSRVFGYFLEWGSRTGQTCEQQLIFLLSSYPLNFYLYFYFVFQFFIIFISLVPLGCFLDFNSLESLSRFYSHGIFFDFVFLQRFYYLSLIYLFY